MKQENIGESLKKYFKEKGLTQEQIAERLGVTQGYITQLLNGKSAFGKGNAKKWEEIFGISESFLLTGKGPMLKENDISGHLGKEDDDYVPLLPVEAMAGTLQVLSQGVELASCRKIKAPVKGADWAIQISGDSMEPDYKNGSILYIKKITGSFIPWGNPIVVDTLDGVVFKEIYPVIDNAEFIEAKSINPKYPPFQIETSLILGLYRVLGGSFINSTI